MAGFQTISFGRFWVIPEGPTTGYAHPKCYAAALRDCSAKLTGEHPFSESVLRELGGNAVVVRGFPWQRTRSQRVGVGSLESKVLCDRHNPALSPLDVVAVRFFRNVRRIEAALRAGTGTTSVVLFAGLDIERWLLKALIGFASAGAARTVTGEPIPWTPPELWLRVLFGRCGFPRTWGLYVSGRIGERENLDPGDLSIAPLTTEDTISGCIATVAGFQLVVALRDVTARRTGALNDDSVHRPDELLFVNEKLTSNQSLCFTWTAGRGNGQVRMTWCDPSSRTR